MTSKEALKFAEENGAEMVDFKFCDFPGTWQHFTTPINQLENEVFEEGLGFDGSSIRGWQAIDQSDFASPMGVTAWSMSQNRARLT